MNRGKSVLFEGAVFGVPALGWQHREGFAAGEAANRPDYGFLLCGTVTIACAAVELADASVAVYVTV